MLARLSEWLIKVAKGWVALAALIIFLLFTALVLPGQAAGSAERTGGARQPDTSLFYTPADLYDMAEAFGPAGRPAYIQARVTFDVVWPLVYGFYFVTGISWLVGRAFPASGRAALGRRLNLAPVLGVGFDYLENLATSLVMARYPASTPVVDLLAGPFTLVKWIFVGGSFVVLVLVTAVALRRQFAAKT